MLGPLQDAGNTTTIETAKTRQDYWGRLVEFAVGAYLINHPMN